MNNVKEKAFEYISDQLRIFIINRLAQSPSSSQQLATSFSILVDDLTVTEGSLDHILDALVKAHIVEFDDVNGVRMYYLMRFDGDNIFELDLEIVERLIVENDIPYYENTIPSSNDDLYFEYIDNKICIHINRPIEIPEMPIQDSEFETENEVTNDDSSSVDASSDTIETINIVKENGDESAENEDKNNQFDVVEATEEKSSLSNDNNEIFEQENDILITSADNEEQFVFDKIQIEEYDQKTEIEANFNENNKIVSTECEDNIETNNSIDNYTANSSDKADNTKAESFVEVADNIDTEELKKAISEDIDFSSPVETVSYSSNNSASDDFFNSYFADYIPKDSQESVKEPVEEHTKEDIIEDSSNEKIEIVESLSKKENDSISFDKSIGDNIVFTSNVYVEPSVTTPEEDNKRIEEALRKLDEYASPKEKPEEIELADTTSSNSDEIEFYDVSINDIVRESEVKPTEDKDEVEIDEAEKKNTSPLSVRAYIEEQELINNYDWEKKLSRVFVDNGNDLEEESNNTESNVIVSTYSELKDIMEKKNYKFKAYSNYDSVSFYSQNYVFSNRINKSTSIYTYLFMLIEIIIGYLFVDKYINRGLMPYLVLAIGLLVIPVVFILKYVYFKDKRKPANFHFSISFVTALMLYANLMVMVVLLAFFIPSLNVSINNISSMITTIFYPAGLLLAIPFSVCVYSVLYNSKKYHLH